MERVWFILCFTDCRTGHKNRRSGRMKSCDERYDVLDVANACYFHPNVFFKPLNALVVIWLNRNLYKAGKILFSISKLLTPDSLCLRQVAPLLRCLLWLSLLSFYRELKRKGRPFSWSDTMRIDSEKTLLWRCQKLSCNSLYPEFSVSLLHALSPA